ncbi:guanylate kinase [Neptunicoccus cionae]|uniref:Guanylate kinase n=1 Tax=Neptunicoccus cionae TaxID=2035344 RepID=A0A916VNZ5_9RHOB|nr:guanylate kinase [Amylibacter cionae]GGA14609.1 guanylate kinase [Amylibacter cionae]
MSEQIRSGLLIIISSPSGAGKSTLAKRLLAKDPAIDFSVSATTRPMRPQEVEGKDYYFKSQDEFLRMVAEGEMLEHAEVFGNHYGSPLAPVAAAVAMGQDVLFDVDWQGGQQIRASSLRDNVVSIFLLPPSIEELESRLNARGQDSAEVVNNRMSKARDEISHWPEYDYVLVNEDLEACETQLRSIVTAERLRRDRQPGLVERVRKLNAECEAML